MTGMELQRHRHLLLAVFSVTLVGAILSILAKWPEPSETLPYAVAAIMALATILLVWKRPGTVRAVEVITCTILLTINMVTLYADLFVLHVHRGDVMYWVSAIYLYAFFAFSRKTGLIICSVLFGVKLAMTTLHIILYGDPWGTFIPFHASQAVTIVFSYFLMLLKEQYTAEIERMALTDSLVNKPNRRHLYALLTSEVDRARRYSRSLSIMMLDIDHFKEVNDAHGHLIGDAVLREFADLAGRSLRLADRFGRWGGEEFLVIAPETGEAAALQTAERLRNAIASHTFVHGNHLTASIGCATMRTDDTLESLVRRADEALYLAKRAGRDQVQAAGSE